MPHNAIPGHGEYHETPAAGTPTAIAAQREGTTPDAYAAEHGRPEHSDHGAAAAGPLASRERVGSGSRAAEVGSAGARGRGLASGRTPWYDDDRFGAALCGFVVVGVLAVAWYVHRNDED